ncbi:MAG: hypothetical protein AAGH81_00265 [Bacteroidota bacterium]
MNKLKSSNSNSGNKEITGDFVEIDGSSFYKISNCDNLRPFFMSIVSDSNHWMFISSNGGLSAGRKNAQYALFPYYTDDKITESAEITGSKTLVRIKDGNAIALWEPFSIRNSTQYRITRNLYKSIHGNKVLFEEINHSFNLTFRYRWSSSNTYGFLRESFLKNHGTSTVDVEILDGIQNVLPYGVPSETQNRASNLVDAYKRTELVPDVGLGIYALSAIIVDKAEPSEALKANVVWSLGMEGSPRLLSSLQLNDFRKGRPLYQETDIKGEKGAYFVHSTETLASDDVKQWSLVANVNQDQSDIVALCERLKDPIALGKALSVDVELGTQKLLTLNASSDSQQCTSDALKDTRHFSNTLFNIMRGGIFDDNYRIGKKDFSLYLKHANRSIYTVHKEVLSGLPEQLSLQELKALITTVQDDDFERLSIEYLPLKFSRRHGDPSRPWNIFSINTHSEVDGSKILDYEGNWRDIFQNWEALAYSYPGFIDGMILKFFNASTFDGYNPYRITKGGFDWEIIEPDDPWSYIGYWGDHQIIYSLKFLEFIQDHYPERLKSYFEKEIFVYANVPYKIKSYQELLINPKDTIDFDAVADASIRKERHRIGADGALLRQGNGQLLRVNFIEKMLASVLAKISNFIPGGGIWMNTQRPEWNDANNALVGNGVSMVTLYYLRRYLKFFDHVFKGLDDRDILISEELLTFFKGTHETLRDNLVLLSGAISDENRRKVLDGLGTSASSYREKIYKDSFSGKKQQLSTKELKSFVEVALQFLEHSIGHSERPDGMYHAYNLMSIGKDGGVSISYLSEMLEGQVAVLSSGYLNGERALNVLDGLKSSSLYREDQYSYILYPNKDLPKFIHKNTVPDAIIDTSKLLTSLVEKGNVQIVKKDSSGKVHFNGNFRNAKDVEKALETLDPSLFPTSKKEREGVLDAFEAVFDHKSFTGRSGTFFGYEGLGSIYWHMVSKLLFAVKECCIKAIKNGEEPSIVESLLRHFYEINEGIGVHKSPELYGAFPTDPYSHTPAGKGAQQPGMTGQVKEDILSRFGELGVTVQKGQIGFEPVLLRKEEFLGGEKVFTYVTIQSEHKEITLQPGSLGFTYCQIPVVYTMAEGSRIETLHKDGSQSVIQGTSLNTSLSDRIFKRTGDVVRINVSVAKTSLR